MNKVVGIVTKPVLDKKKELLWQNLYIQQNIADILNKYDITCMGIIPQGIKLDRVNSDDINLEIEEDLTESEKKHIINQMKLCNGIILQGGISSHKYEIFIAQYAIENNIPIIGICAGFNNILRAIGIEVEYDKEIANIHDIYSIEKYHKVYTQDNAKVIKQTCEVNSIHTMSIAKSILLNNEHVNIEAIAIDNIDGKEIETVEAFKLNNTKFAVGIKWHPELLPDDEITNIIFKIFIKELGESK